MKVVFHPKFHEVYTSDPAAEAGRMESILKEISDFEFVEAEKAGEEDILLVHTLEHYAYVKSYLKIYEVAMFAVGGTIRASEIAFEEPSFALVRPPGHHASPDHSWGFCYFNNVAIAIKRLFKAKKIERAVIIDFDLHYGDGTANIFRGDKNVTYFHMNDADIEGIERILEEEEYEIIAVSAGFDRHKDDWGGLLETEDYEEIGKIIAKFAKKRCNGRRFGALEGGYNHEVLGRNVRAFLDGFS
jgi:acetoin utilization deacetylase AcuC-like enzyme